MRKTVALLGKVLFGKNTGHLGSRFEYHIVTLIALFLFTAVGMELGHIAERQTSQGGTLNTVESWVIGASNVTYIAAIVILGYLFLVSGVFVVLGLLLKGEPEEPVTTA